MRITKGPISLVTVSAVLLLPLAGHAQEATEAAIPTDEAPVAPAVAPAASAPPGPKRGEASPATGKPRRAVLVARPGVTFYRVPGEGEEPVRLCMAPCTTLLSGQHHLALGFEGGSPEATEEPVSWSTSSVVEGEYRSRTSTRQTGWLIMGLGIPASLAALATGIGLATEEGDGSTRTMGGAMAAGGGLFLATSLVMVLVMGLAGDDASVHVRLEAAAEE